MGRLKDIAGYYRFGHDYTFNDQNMWQGKIVLDDDGWFEGIVTDSNSDFTGDRMVFGFYHPDKIINLLKLTPEEISAPFVFRGVRDAKGYNGEFLSLDWFGEHFCGVSQIIIRDVALFQEFGYDAEELKDRNVEVEKDELLKRLEAFKSNCPYKTLYKNTFAKRKFISSVILENYEFALLRQKSAGTGNECPSVNDDDKSPIDQGKKLTLEPSNNEDLKD